jgi:hypothetical protein
MRLLKLLKTEAVQRGLLETEAEIDPATAFTLVRDMPYLRASSRRPETIIKEWRGTCSGKHYLLKALFAELGLYAKVMACTARQQIDPAQAPPELGAILEQSGGCVVDVHNYLVLDSPQGEMFVDATWPLATKALGLTVNQSFVLGQSQELACRPLETWTLPDDGDPQQVKEDLLRQHFTPQELAHRDTFIRTLGELLSRLPASQRNG